MLAPFLVGIICSLYFVGALFFFKFWSHTRDRLFLAFALAFLIEGINRIRFIFIEAPSEAGPDIYLVRLFAFALIAVAIAAKNFEKEDS